MSTKRLIPTWGEMARRVKDWTMGAIVALILVDRLDKLPLFLIGSALYLLLLKLMYWLSDKARKSPPSDVPVQVWAEANPSALDQTPPEDVLDHYTDRMKTKVIHGYRGD